MQLRHRRWAIWWRERSFAIRLCLILGIVGLLLGAVFSKELYRELKVWRAEQLLDQAEAGWNSDDPSDQHAAQRSLQAAVQLAPFHYPVARRYAEALRQQNHPEAVTFWQFLVDLPEASDEDRLQLIELLLPRGSLEEARMVWKQIAEESRQTRMGGEIAVRLLLSEGRFSEARERLEKLVERFPEDVALQRAYLNMLEGIDHGKAATSRLRQLAERLDAVGLMALRQLAWEQFEKNPTESQHFFRKLRDHPHASSRERAIADAVSRTSEFRSSELALILRDNLDARDPQEAERLARALWRLEAFEAFDDAFPAAQPNGSEFIAERQMARLQQLGNFDGMRAFVAAKPAWPREKMLPWIDLEEALATGNEAKALRLFDDLLSASGERDLQLPAQYLDNPIFEPWRETILRRLENSGGQTQARIEGLRLLEAYRNGNDAELDRLVERVSLDTFRAQPQRQAGLIYLKLLVTPTDASEFEALTNEVERLRRVLPAARFPRFLEALAQLGSGQIQKALQTLAETSGKSTEQNLSPSELLILAAVLGQDPDRAPAPLIRTVEALPLRAPERAFWERQKAQMPAANQAN